jgi:hypothetical protein
MKTIIEMFDHWITWLCALILACAIALALYELVPWSLLPKPDWGTWIGSLGTVGTLLGTVVLANRQTAQKREADLNLAALVSVEILPKVFAAKFVVGQVRRLISMSYSPKQIYDATGSNIKLADLCDWEAKTVVPLVVLPNHAAFHLENARCRITFAEQMLVDRQPNFDDANPYTLDSVFVSSLDVILGEAIDSLQVAGDEMVKISPDRSRWA